MKNFFIQHYKFFLLLFLLLSLGFFMIEGLSTHMETVKTEKEIEIIKSEIGKEEEKNKENKKVLEGDISEYLERRAREKLGYAYADDKVYYAINS